MSEDSRRRHLRRSVPRLIGWMFGSLWAQLAPSALPPPLLRAGYVVAGVLALGFLVRLWRYQPDEDTARPLFRSPAYLIAVAAEVICLVAVSIVLPRHGAQQQVPSVAGFLVGLHFFGLWVATRSARFLQIMAGMCAISAFSMFLPIAWHAVGLRQFVLGAGNALVLWLAASGGE